MSRNYSAGSSDPQAVLRCASSQPPQAADVRHGGSEHPRIADVDDVRDSALAEAPRSVDQRRERIADKQGAAGVRMPPAKAVPAPEFVLVEQNRRVCDPAKLANERRSNARA